MRRSHFICMFALLFCSCDFGYDPQEIEVVKNHSKTVMESLISGNYLQYFENGNFDMEILQEGYRATFSKCNLELASFKLIDSRFSMINDLATKNKKNVHWNLYEFYMPDCDTIQIKLIYDVKDKEIELVRFQVLGIID